MGRNRTVFFKDVIDYTPYFTESDSKIDRERIRYALQYFQEVMSIYGAVNLVASTVSYRLAYQSFLSIVDMQSHLRSYTKQILDRESRINSTVLAVMYNIERGSSREGGLHAHLLHFVSPETQLGRNLTASYFKRLWMSVTKGKGVFFDETVYDRGQRRKGLLGRLGLITLQNREELRFACDKIAYNSKGRTRAAGRGSRVKCFSLNVRVDKSEDLT